MSDADRSPSARPSSRTIRLLRTAALLAAVGVLAGCSASSGVTPASSLAGAPSTTEETPNGLAESGWAVVDEVGVGPSTVTIVRPSLDAAYFSARFTCTAGDSRVELREDTRVFMSGPCGGASNYQMPLPSDVTELNLVVDVGAGVEFSLSGTFIPHE